MTKAIAYIDGSGNSSRKQACACVLYVRGVPHFRTRLLPAWTTNNVGEYSGLLLAIRLAKELGVEVLQIRSDSKLVVHQVREEWRCKEDHLRQLRDEAWRECQRFREVSIEWIPREENEIADGLCREAIRQAESRKNDSITIPRLSRRGRSLPEFPRDSANSPFDG